MPGLRVCLSLGAVPSFLACARQDGAQLAKSGWAGTPLDLNVCTPISISSRIAHAYHLLHVQKLLDEDREQLTCYVCLPAMPELG